MSPNESPGADPTTDTDEALLASASEAQSEPTSARHMPGASEHPPGHAEPEEPQSDRDYAGPAVRRQAKSA
jgi:hypothetical protein